MEGRDVAISRSFWLCIAAAEGSLLMGFSGSNPLFLGGLAGALIVGLRCGSLNISPGPARLRRLFYGLFLVMGGAWLVKIFVDYYALKFSGFDTGIYANLLGNLVSGRGYYSSILEKPGLANHFTPNLMLLGPLFLIAKTFLWLPLVKLLAFLACPIILLRLSRAVLGSDASLAWLPALLWLINKPLARTLDFEFQVSSLALPFVLLAFLFAVRRQPIRLVVCLLFLLGFKEHMALAWLSIGCFLIAMQGERAKGGVIAAGGLALGAFIYFAVMPSFAAGGELSHIHRFGPAALLDKKLQLIVKGLLSVGFLPLLAPRSLWFLLPAYGLALVSADPQMVSYSFHYQDLPLTVLFVSLIYGLQRLQEAPPRFLAPPRIQRVAALLTMILVLAANNYFPTRGIRKSWPSPEQRALVKELQKAAPAIPLNTPLLATDALTPFFFMHPRVKSLIAVEQLRQTAPQTRIVSSPAVDQWPLSPSQAAELQQVLADPKHFKKLTGQRLTIHVRRKNR